MTIPIPDYMYENNWLNKKLLKQYKSCLQKIYIDINNICPLSKNIFRAFKYFSLDELKVVILGQDPYPNLNNAIGLSFSVSKDQKIPASLLNMFKELHNDLNIVASHGCLTKWSKQGVLLLNAALTTEINKSNSHLFWHTATDYCIKRISRKCNNIVFILLGNFAKKKSNLIDSSKHLIITAGHPSPLNRSIPFIGSKIYSKTNDYLKQHNIEEIDWSI